MIEKNYTIPVNEAFDLFCGCPICTLYKKLESNELDMILGASMMEPAIRIKTNERGFCGKHYDMMFNMKNRLGLALMLETHLSENIVPSLKGNLITGILKKSGKDKFAKQSRSCYICERVEHSQKKMEETVTLLFELESEFRDKLAKQPFFCVPHYASLLEVGEYMLGKKTYPDFCDAMKAVMVGYSVKLKEDVSWFVKKFDYNYENEPWGDAKDAVERAIRFLSDFKQLESLRKDK